VLVRDVLLAQSRTPHPGVDARVNPPPWDAPRVAYLLTAAMADTAQAAGAIVPGADMSAAWAGYDASAQQDILTALGAQTRLALKMLYDKLGVEIEMDTEPAARAVCSEALVSARELIKPTPGTWATPECAHCREIIAKALCGLQIEAYFRLGFTPAMIAAMCRQSADMAESSSRH
jgi:hypothetical protein